MKTVNVKYYSDYGTWMVVECLDGAVIWVGHYNDEASAQRAASELCPLCGYRGAD